MTPQETIIVNLFEGSDLYASKLVVKPETETQLFTGILDELNHQFNYRPTNESLWGEVKYDGKVFHVERLLKAQAQVTEWGDTKQQYQFIPLEEYVFTMVMGDTI